MILNKINRLNVAGVTQHKLLLHGQSDCDCKLTARVRCDEQPTPGH